MTMGNSQEDQNDQRRQEADMHMLDSLLRQTLRPDPEARDVRIQRVLQHLDDPTPIPSEDDSRSVVQIDRAPNHTRRWISLAVAVSLVLAVGLWWQVRNPSRQAYATVEESLQQATEAGAREYLVTVVVHRPLAGRDEIVDNLYVDGEERFALRHQPILPLGEVWIGGNEREKWIVPTRGPILVGNLKMLQNWMGERETPPAPYLHITTILERMSNGYYLQMLPDEDIAVPERPNTTVRCRRVRGALRDPKFGRPRLIDLWADRDSGIARRLILDWQIPPGQLGRSKITVELVGRRDLPPDWFEHSAHHDEGRTILRAGL